MWHKQVACWLVAVAVGSPAWAEIIHVPGDWPTIDQAIDAASNYDEIVVAPGVYNETIDFRGKILLVHSSDGPATTTIDGGGLNLSVVTFDTGERSDTVLRGFRITNGNFNNGAGVRVVNSSPTIEDCIVTGNTASGEGGGVLISGMNSSPVLSTCIVRGNNSDKGGGVSIKDASPRLVDCAVNDNAARYGGGIQIDNDPGRSVLVECTIQGNSAANDGGGIHISNGASAELLSCVIAENASIQRGGGVYCSDPTSPLMVSCTFRGNTAGADGGGGMYIHLNASALLVNCVFYRNEAEVESGGGIHVSTVDTTLLGCTFAFNTAASKGGGVYTLQGNLVTRNSVLWANSDSHGEDASAQFHADGGTAFVDYCCILGGWPGPGVGNIELDPMFIDVDNDDFRLSAGSPCIDAGANNAVPADTLDLDEDGDTSERWPRDLDGNPRFAGDPGTDATGCGEPVVVDMGPYEYPGEAVYPILIGDVDGDGVVGFNDVLEVLSAWGECGDADCCLADIDFSGMVDFDDLLIGLANWS